MTDRDCANCKHHTENGCSSWDCEYEPKDLISRADAIDAVRKDIEFEKEHAIPYEDYDSGCIGGLKKAMRTRQAQPSADAVTFEDARQIRNAILFKEYLRGRRDAEAVWIPCSERLPSKDGRYLVCMNWDYDNIETLNWADGWNCCREINGKVQRESEIDGADIIAWMPLPTPYKGGDDE